MTPQARTRKYLTERGWLVGSVERRKKFPDRKKSPCKACGHQPMIEISDDLWNVFDLAALHPILKSTIFVQTTSSNNHSTRRNKILSSMEAKLVLLSGDRILLQSWRQGKDSRWLPTDEWIVLDDYKQAPHYPNTVFELQEIKRKAKLPALPPGAHLLHDEILKEEEIPF